MAIDDAGIPRRPPEGASAAASGEDEVCAPPTGDPAPPGGAGGARLYNYSVCCITSSAPVEPVTQGPTSVPPVGASAFEDVPLACRRTIDLIRLARQVFLTLATSPPSSREAVEACEAAFWAEASRVLGSVPTRDPRDAVLTDDLDRRAALADEVVAAYELDDFVAFDRGANPEVFTAKVAELIPTAETLIAESAEAAPETWASTVEHAARGALAMLDLAPRKGDRFRLRPARPTDLPLRVFLWLARLTLPTKVAAILGVDHHAVTKLLAQHKQSSEERP